MVHVEGVEDITRFERTAKIIGKKVCWLQLGTLIRYFIASTFERSRQKEEACLNGPEQDMSSLS
jgi:hypothetical protein